MLIPWLYYASNYNREVGPTPETNDGQLHKRSAAKEKRRREEKELAEMLSMMISSGLIE